MSNFIVAHLIFKKKLATGRILPFTHRYLYERFPVKGKIIPDFNQIIVISAKNNEKRNFSSICKNSNIID